MKLGYLLVVFADDVWRPPIVQLYHWLVHIHTHDGE